MKKNTIVLTIFSIIHFIVDFSCIYFMYNLFIDNNLNQSTIITMVIIYNFFAFFMQAPFGIMIDYFKGSYKYGALGCLLIILSTFFYKYKLISVMILGIGNALFHLSGGVEILNRAEKKATMPGIYVSTGALGLFLGANVSTVGAKLCEPALCIVYIILITSAIVLFIMANISTVVANKNNVVANVSPVGAKLREPAYICVITLIICVIIRSFVGMVSIFLWKKIFVYSFLLTLATVFGKFFGGIISDKFTAKKTTFISLFLSAVLYIFADKSALAGIIATFLFNMTMPITLIYLSNILDDKKGFAFGLTTFGLFLGYLPVALHLIDANMFMKYIPFIVLLQNMLLLYAIVKTNKHNT